MDLETEALLARVPQHQTPLLAPSLIVEGDIVAGADGAAGTGTAVADVLRSLMTDPTALGVDLRKVDGAAALVIGMNATTTATSTQIYDPGTHLEMTVNLLSEIYHVILVTREILATLLTATPARKSTDRALWPPSL